MLLIDFTHSKHGALLDVDDEGEEGPEGQNIQPEPPVPEIFSQTGGIMD